MPRSAVLPQPTSEVPTLSADTLRVQPSVPSLSPHTTRPAGSEHIVHFYQDDSFLVHSLVHFLSAGIVQNEVCLVIATREHQRLVNQYLAKQFDLEQLQATGRLFYWDAAEQAAELVVDGQLDRQLFADRFGQPIAQLVQRGQKVRGFGEIVSLLWAQDMPGQAVELEQTWHDLGDKWPFTLLCAYSLSHVSQPGRADLLQQVCQHHTQSIPDYSSLQSQLHPSGEVA